jgi:hypothetical protein
MPVHKPVTLLLTATISPPKGATDLARCDPSDRLRDYSEALRFYLSRDDRLIDKIIFVENSNSDLSPLVSLSNAVPHNKEVEFVSFIGGNDFPPEYGKGYGEMKMIAYALDRSRLAKRTRVFWKATGRLKLLNIERLIERSPLGEYDLYCDMRSANGLSGLFTKINEMDARFYSFTHHGYDTFFKFEEGLLRRAHIEHLLFDRVLKLLPREKVVPRFLVQPYIGGYSGSENKNYSSVEKTLQRHVQYLFRILLPNVWL